MTWPPSGSAPEPLDDDEAISREEAGWRRSQQARALQQIRQRRLALQRMAPDEIRHTGPDRGMHHLPQLVNAPGFSPDYSDDPLNNYPDDPVNILGEQIVDQYTAYEEQKERYAQQEQEEARAWLESHRPVNRGSW